MIRLAPHKSYDRPMVAEDDKILKAVYKIDRWLDGLFWPITVLFIAYLVWHMVGAGWL